MECNKEEAVRAKAVAEKKMQCRDYDGARKMVLKAQRLFPDLENTSQMLTVCEVHCSAEARVNGFEDWYGILQVEASADEALIKKQYRKLALLLHPDKNKFAGAEAAFKLIGEAHRILSDKMSRTVYDLKRTSSVKTAVLKSQSGAHNSRKQQPPVPGGFANHAPPFSNFHHAQAARPPQPQTTTATSGSATFWTLCPSCRIRYQYYYTILNKPLRCQNCLKPFVAYEIEPQVAPGVVNFGFPLNKSGLFPQAQHTSSAGQNHGKEQCKNDGTGPVPTVFTKVFGQGSSHEKKPTEDKKEEKAEVEEMKVAGKQQQTASNGQPSGNANVKRGRKMTVESESDSDDSDDETMLRNKQSAGYSSDHRPRRSSRLKQNISYADEANSDGDDTKPPSNFKRLRKRSSTEPVHGNDEEQVEAPAEETCNPSNETNSTMEKPVTPQETPKKATGNKAAESTKSDDSDSDSDSGPGVNTNYLDYPDPEFYDFDNDRSPECFSAGQIWSLYDFLDGMPRFYALIKSVSSANGFKVRFSWLEHVPIGEAEKKWTDEELPVGCGAFRLGKAETSDVSRVFSHPVTWSKGNRKNQYLIVPRKGEVWALFRGWDKNWSEEPEKHQKFDYEVVEVLSDFNAESGADVVHLVKVQGFTCVFRQRGGDAVHVAPDELLRFSHQVPAYRMKGTEREGISEGFFELDFGSLPVNMDPEVEDTAEKPADEVRYEDSEFHDFEEERGEDKFRAGQVWALYCEDDGFPKYYAIVKKVETEEFTVELTWLEAEPRSEVEAEWLSRGLPLGCGRFRLLTGKDGKQSYTATDTFSHVVQARQIAGGTKRGPSAYDIGPRPGEVWAVYRNWRSDWEMTDLEKCMDAGEYDMVEIRSSSEVVVVAAVLEKVEGFRTVFRAATATMMTTTVLEIGVVEMTRFSHQVPAFRLTEERGGNLRGCFELDPASVPEVLLCSG
ncbi:uncharacterized protein LOC144715469 [Wolffia australiana]